MTPTTASSGSRTKRAPGRHTPPVSASDGGADGPRGQPPSDAGVHRHRNRPRRRLRPGRGRAGPDLPGVGRAQLRPGGGGHVRHLHRLRGVHGQGGARLGRRPGGHRHRRRPRLRDRMAHHPAAPRPAGAGQGGGHHRLAPGAPDGRRADLGFNLLPPARPAGEPAADRGRRLLPRPGTDLSPDVLVEVGDGRPGDLRPGAADPRRPLPARRAKAEGRMSIGARRLSLLVVALVAVVWPAMLSDFSRSLATDGLIFGLIVLSLVLLTGFVGQISFCQYSFAAVGAFTVGSLVAAHHWSFWLAMPLGVIGAAIVGALVGIPALRLSGLFLTILTVAVALFFDRFVLAPGTWNSFSGGLSSFVVGRPSFLGIHLDTSYRLYLFVLGR